MNRRTFLLAMSSSVFLPPFRAESLFHGCRAGQKKPNIILFLIDDMGWKDLGCYGSTFYETPRIDGLASGGIRFLQAYAASPVCSPTRAGIMTGKHPARLHITDWIGGRQAGKLMPASSLQQLALEEITIAEILKNSGYATALIGKWHLGNMPFCPENQGFDRNTGGTGAGHPASYFYPYKNDQKKWDVPHLENGLEGEYLTDRLTEEAISFIQSHRRGPFFLMLSHYAVHTPVQAKKEYVDKYKIKNTGMAIEAGYKDGFALERNAYSRLKQDNPVYAGMVQSVDESVGSVLGSLEKLGIRENTVVIFASDNGGLSTLVNRNAPTSNKPLRAGKGWLYEGGIRIPLIFNWPGHIRPGLLCPDPVITTDLFSTLLSLAGLDPEKYTADGTDLFPLLEGKSEKMERTLYWHFPHYHGSGNTPSSAVRCGNFKLIRWYEDNVMELYDLEKDPHETTDLVSLQPDRAKELYQMLQNWLYEVHASLPKLDPHVF